MISWTFDVSTDARYFTLLDEPIAHQEQLIGDSVILDLSEAGDIVGIEVIGVVDPARLKDALGGRGVAQVALDLLGPALASEGVIVSATPDRALVLA